MTEIELPTYRAIVPNEVFGRRAKPLKRPLVGGKAKATQIATISKSRIPEREEAIDLVRRSAKGIDLVALGKSKPTEEEIKETYFLRLLPVPEIKGIAEGDKEIIEHLKKHYKDGKLQNGRDYILFANGIVPDEFLDSVPERLRKEGVGVYNYLIDKAGREEWYLKIRLLENGAFPDILELDYLLDRGVKDSDVFSVAGNFGDYQNVTNQIRLLYRALNSLEFMSQVKDTSFQVLGNMASSMMQETVKCILGRDLITGVMGGLEGMIKQAVEEFSEKQESGESGLKPFRCDDDYSRN